MSDPLGVGSQIPEIESFRARVGIVRAEHKLCTESETESDLRDSSVFSAETRKHTHIQTMAHSGLCGKVNTSILHS